MQNAVRPRGDSPGWSSYADICQALVVGFAINWKFDAINALISPGGYNLVEAKAAHASAAAILALAPFLLPRSLRRLAWLGMAVLVSLLALVDLMYVRYFDTIPPVSALLYGCQAIGVRHSLITLWQPRDVLFLADPLVLAVLWPLWRRLRQDAMSLWLERGVALTAMTLCVVRLGGLVADFDRQYPRALATAWNPRYISASIGLFTYHLVDVYNTARAAVRPPITPTQIGTIATWLERRDGVSASPAVAANANLIIIQVEALQQFALQRSVAGGRITPNLDSFVNESLYFPNVYGQTGDGNTADAEFMTNTGMFSLDHGAAFVCYPHNTYDALAHRLARQGYRSVAMHANAPAFWNRYLMYPALGYATFENATSYTDDERVGLGLSDRSFFRQSLVLLQHLPKPFHATLVTLSSHHPYDDTAHFGPFPVGTYEGTMLGNYLKSLHYADAQLGTFLAGLKRTGLLDSSVVVIYGDHPGLSRTDFPALANLVGVSPDTPLAWLKLQKVPLLIHVPHGLQHGVMPAPAGQIDIMPTIAHLLGISARGTFGRDLLGPAPAEVVLRDASVITQGIYFDASKRRAYDLASEQPVPGVSVDAPLARAATAYEYSNAIVKHDLVHPIEQAWLAEKPQIGKVSVLRP